MQKYSKRSVEAAITPRRHITATRTPPGGRRSHADSIQDGARLPADRATQRSIAQSIATKLHFPLDLHEFKTHLHKYPLLYDTSRTSTTQTLVQQWRYQHRNTGQQHTN